MGNSGTKQELELRGNVVCSGVLGVKPMATMSAFKEVFFAITDAGLMGMRRTADEQSPWHWVEPLSEMCLMPASAALISADYREMVQFQPRGLMGELQRGKVTQGRMREMKYLGFFDEALFQSWKALAMQYGCEDVAAAMMASSGLVGAAPPSTTVNVSVTQAAPPGARYCGKCGKANAGDQNFCGACGTPLQ